MNFILELLDYDQVWFVMSKWEHTYLVTCQCTNAVFIKCVSWYINIRSR